MHGSAQRQELPVCPVACNGRTHCSSLITACCYCSMVAQWISFFLGGFHCDKGRGSCNSHVCRQAARASAESHRAGSCHSTLIALFALQPALYACPSDLPRQAAVPACEGADTTGTSTVKLIFIPSCMSRIFVGTCWNIFQSWCQLNTTSYCTRVLTLSHLVGFGVGLVGGWGGTSLLTVRLWPLRCAHRMVCLSCLQTLKCLAYLQALNMTCITMLEGGVICHAVLCLLCLCFGIVRWCECGCTL